MVAVLCTCSVRGDFCVLSPRYIFRSLVRAIFLIIRELSYTIPDSLPPRQHWRRLRALSFHYAAVLLESYYMVDLV